MPQDEQQEIKLHYIDKIHTPLFEAGRRGHGVATLYTSLSVIVILLTTGVISVGQQLTFAGITISLSSPVLLGGAACAIAVFSYYEATLGSYQAGLYKEVMQIYETLGFTFVSQPLEMRGSGFIYPDASTVVYSAFVRAVIAPFIIAPVRAALPNADKMPKMPLGLRVRFVLFGLALMLLGLTVGMLPLTAEFLATRAVILQQGWNWVIILVIIALIVLTIVTWLTAAEAAHPFFGQVFQAFRAVIARRPRPTKPEKSPAVTVEPNAAQDIAPQSGP